MKKTNKKLISSIILGLILYTPVTNVYAAQLNDGAIYGNGDNYESYRTENSPNVFEYDFRGDSQLKLENTTDTQGVYIIGFNPSVEKIIIENKLDIDLNKSTNNVGTLRGIILSSNNFSHKTIDRKAGGDITIKSSNATSMTDLVGVDATGGSNNSILIGDSNIRLEAITSNLDASLTGLYIGAGNENSIIMGEGKIYISGKIQSDSAFSNAIGMMVFDNNDINTGDVSIDIDITNNQNVNNIVSQGLDAELGGEITTGNGAININVTGGQAITANGVFASDGGKVTKTGGNIIATAEGEGTLAARGIFANGGAVSIGISDVTAKAIGGSNENGNWIEAIGLVGWGNGEINYAGGTITAVADNEDAYVTAIHAQDNGNINVNKGTNNKVVINGDVNNYGRGSIFLNLNTADSALNGRVYDANGTFNLANNAQWNVLDNSTVNNFNIDKGIVNMSTAGNVSITNYSGNGTVSFQAEDVAPDGVMILNTGNIAINKAAQGSDIILGVANNAINTLDIAKTEENLNAVANKVYYDANDGNLNGKVVIREGLITPEASGDLLFDANDRGYVTNITGGNRTTETMYAMKNLAATAIVAWRQEDSTLSQRLGELRDSEGGQGIWVRMSRGEFEYDGEYKNQYNFFQMGYDWAADDWHYGAAISHNDGQTTYFYGDGENRSTSLSLYGTWLGDKGHYADVVLKQGRLSLDFDIYTSVGHTSGDYDAWGTSLSGEYGKKIALEDDWYITPQAQLTLMRIGGEDYTTNNGIRVHQDTLHSAVGRLGFELGKKIADKGSVYAKASLLHDFAGNAETYLSYNGFANSYSQDIGDTWCEAGIGVNYKTSENSYVYADVVKTFGGDVETPWQWNAGMRWSF